MSEPARPHLTKQQVHSFLIGLQEHINDSVTDQGRVEEAVRERTKKSHSGTSLEAAFIDEFVLRKVHSYLAQEHSVVNGTKAPQELILAESSWAKTKDVAIACGTPVKNSGHPFYKVLGISPRNLYLRWSGKDPRGRKTTFAAVCPDFALFAPYRIVFECKYFNQRAQQPAVSQLVEGLYQTFFYRAMPTLPSGVGLKHGWDYEYSCFLAYDATPNLRLTRAWNDLGKIRERFWIESNIFVMIFTSDGKTDSHANLATSQHV